MFGGKLETQLRAVLLLAFHKVPTDKSETVLSNSQLDAAVRKRKRPRGQRGGRTDAAATSATIFEQVTEGAGVGSSSLMSSSMPSTLPCMAEPRVGPLPCTPTGTEGRFLVLSELNYVLIWRGYSGGSGSSGWEAVEIPSIKEIQMFIRPWGVGNGRVAPAAALL